MDAASEVVTVPASDVSATTKHKSTDTFHVNQSNNNTHTQTNPHTGSNSLLSKIASNVISSSLNIGGSSNSNSSCSSSSTSSNSSGYGSSTTTPTNSYDLQNTTPTTTPIPQTTVANTEHVIPVATVAAVTPFFNEAITTHNLGTQLHHHHHHAQQTQEQLQQQQNHALQTHHQQYAQNYLQANLQHQQHHQYLSRQQYFAPYDYQQSAATHNLPVASATPTVAPYNMIIPAPYEMASSNVSSSAFGTSHYKSAASNQVGSIYERSPLVKTNVAACTQQSQQQHVDQQQSKTVNQHFSGSLGATKPRSSSSFISNSTSTNTSKPQAAATPFYANPIPFYDNYKHKIPLEYPDTYSNSSPATTVSYHQQQNFYAAAKSQLKEASYVSPTGLNSKSAYANTGNVFAGPSSGLNLSSASYDKYMYPHGPTSGYTATGHLGNDAPPEVGNYRKPIMGSNLNSPSWPWGIEYASGNSRSIPPPPVSHIPTATVAPTHATHLAQTPSVLAREPFYMAHDKYVGKYDKYSTSSYAQTYVSPPTNRHMWSNTPHVSNLTQFNERHLLASAPPALPTHGPHAAPYFPNNHNASLTSRQTCCSQPYQSQSCYYPVSHPVQPRLSHNQNNAVAPPTPANCLPGQQTLGQSPHLNALPASCKYGGVFPDYGNANKIKTSNDLYLSSHHYDINPPPHNFSYPTAHNSQQLYNANAHQTMAHTATPSSLLTNDPFNANPTSYTNDLNLTTSNFDNYHTHLENHPSHQTLTGLHNTQPPPAYGPTVAKRALLDYRKPIQPQPPPTIPEDCYPSLTSSDHYNQHELLNTPETTTTFEEYEVHQSSAPNQSTEVLNDSIRVAEESNKNLSLRDFIANWNDDEEEYQNNEEINFDQSTVIDEVLQTAPVEQEAAAEVVTIQEVKVIKPATQTDKDAEPSKDAVKLAEDPGVPLNEKASSQYVNLPDIVIDVKKSNNVNNSITTPSISPTLSPTQVAGNSLNLTDFDVEKELDELNLKKPMQQELTKELNDTKDSKSVNTPLLSPTKNINSQLSFEDLNLEPPTTKTVLNAVTTRLAANQGSELNEQYSKDIEGYESSCSRHSNESAFEKEYETFINKITSESSSATKKGEQKPIKAENQTEFDKNVQNFSKFYKRKRKLKDDGQKTSTRENQSKKKIKTNEATKINNSNFPQVYTKKCRNRLPKVRREPNHKRKPLSSFYKIIYFIRRQGLQRERRMREFMLELRDKHLPLIKRQSIKNYTPDVNENPIIPKTLKALCIMVFNTDEFRQNLLLTRDQQQDNYLETEEKHICTDPTCETCEVIKSLMEADNFEATVMQQTPEQSATVYCAAVTKEAITILDAIPTTNDFSYRNEQTIVISNSVEDSLYSQENLSELITKSVLSENLVLEEQSAKLQLKIGENFQVKDQTEIALQAVFDGFETNFLEADKTEAAVRDFRPQIEEDCDFDKEALTDTQTGVTIEEIDESKIKLMHPFSEAVTETSFYEHSGKSPLYCDLNGVSDFPSANNPSEFPKLNVSEESAENKTSRVEKYLNETCSTEPNILSPGKDGKYDKTRDNEESETEGSSSSGSESESSSSDTYKTRSSSTESSDSDTDNAVEKQEASNLVTRQSNNGEGKPGDKEVTKTEENNASETKAEQTCSSPSQIQTVGSNKNIFDNEKISSSPQRIVIRITKSLTNSPNEQSLRVENISAEPLKPQTESDDHAESSEEDVEDTNEKKTDFLPTQQEDFVSKKIFENQTDSDHAEDGNTEKKLVTPLKLVLRGKEYLRVKSTKKSPKLRTERTDNTDSESENEEIVKRKPKVLKLARTQGKYTKKSKLKIKEVPESDSDNFEITQKLSPKIPKEAFEEIDKKVEREVNLNSIEISTNKENGASDENSEICESADERQEECEEVADIIVGTSSAPKPEGVSEGNATQISFSEEYGQISVEQRKYYIFDDGSANQDYSVETFALDGSLQSSKSEMISAEHNIRNSNLSPKEDNFNEYISQYDLLSDVEVEKADYSENHDELVAENLKKMSSLEVIETYNLTDSEIHSSAYSESTDYDDASDNDAFLKPINCNISNPIVISDDDSLETVAKTNTLEIQSTRNIFKDSKMPRKSTDSKLSGKSSFVENSHIDIMIENSEYSRSSIELHDLNINDAMKEEINHSEQDFSDCSYNSKEDSDEENFSSPSFQKPDEKDVEERSLLDSSHINLEATESSKKVGAGTPEKPLPIDSLEKALVADNTLRQLKYEMCTQLVADSNLEQEKGGIPLGAGEETENSKSLEEGKNDFEALWDLTNQSRELRTKTEKNQDLNRSEEIQSEEDNFKEAIRENRLTPNIIQKDYEICTSEPCSSNYFLTEEECNMPRVIFKEVVQESSDESIDINTSEQIAKVTYNSANRLESAKPSTEVNQSLRDNLKDEEESLTSDDDDDDSCSSKTCSPMPEAGSCTPPSGFEESIAFTESVCNKTNPSTKTKAAYKAYDLPNVTQVERLPDSEIEKSHSNSHMIEVDLNEIRKDHRLKVPVDNKIHNSPLSAPFMPENETKLLVDKTESITTKSDQPVMLDEELAKFDIAEDIKKHTLNISPSTEIPNEVEKIGALEDNVDKTIIEATTATCKETESKICAPESFISICPKNSFTDNIEDSVLTENEIEVSNNDNDVNISSQETTLLVTKDLEEATEDNSKNSAQSTTLDEDDLTNSNISPEIRDQSDITEIENKIPHNSSETLKDDLKDFKSSKAETFSSLNKSDVIDNDSETEEPATINQEHIQEPLDSFDMARENISKSANEDVKSSEILENEEVIHSPGTSNVKTTEEIENKLKELRENTEFKEESSDLSLLPDVRKISEAINGRKIAEVTLENENVVVAETAEEQTKDEERNLLPSIEKSDKVATVDIKFKSKRIEESEGNNLEDSSTPIYKSDQTYEISNISEEVNTNDNFEEKIKEIEPNPDGDETEERDFWQSSTEAIEEDLISEDTNLIKVTNIEEGKEKPCEEGNKSVEDNFKESSMMTLDHSQIETSKEESNEVLREEGNNKSMSMESIIEFQETDFKQSQIDRTCLRPLSEKDSGDKSNKESNLTMKDIVSVSPEPAETTKLKICKESCSLSNEQVSLSQIRWATKDVAKKDGGGEGIEKEEMDSARAKPEIETKDHDLKENLFPHNEFESISERTPVFKEMKEAVNGEEAVSKIKSQPDKDTNLNESVFQEAQRQNLAEVFQQEEPFDVSTKQFGEVSNKVIIGKLECNNEEDDIENQNLNNNEISSLQEKDEEIPAKNEKAESNEEPLGNYHQTLSVDDKQVQPATEESHNEYLCGSVGAKNLTKPCTTPDELSADFYGFKNQSSFEDESEDFHGFEDLEEVARIRQEIENINDDSAANDGFLDNLTLNRAVHKTSIASLTESTTSEINEMEALEKELSQHQLEMEVTDEDKEIEKEYHIKTIKAVSSNDIEHIKQMLESDEELQNDGENNLETRAHTFEDKSAGSRNINIPNDRLGSVSSIIPKLSDLCRAALNSSLNSSSNLAQQQTETSPILVERELSVEQALAEMYRQAGVLLSDTEDYDNDVPPPDDTEGHDVLLINLQEILNSDNNDVYVLQCDMDENVLNVVQPAEEPKEESPGIDGVSSTERVNTVQIILDTHNAEPQIHIISSDSESEVIVLSDDDSEIAHRRKFKARHENVAIPFINDEDINSGDDNTFDISTIHHEEIVPDNLAKFLQDEFYKYLHEKYVQRSISKYYHAQRVLRKYKRRFIRSQ